MMSVSLPDLRRIWQARQEFDRREDCFGVNIAFCNLKPSMLLLCKPDVFRAALLTSKIVILVEAASNEIGQTVTVNRCQCRAIYWNTLIETGTRALVAVLSLAHI